MNLRKHTKTIQVKSQLSYMITLGTNISKPNERLCKSLNVNNNELIQNNFNNDLDKVVEVFIVREAEVFNDNIFVLCHIKKLNVYMIVNKEDLNQKGV